MNQTKKMGYSRGMEAAAIAYNAKILQDIHLPSKSIAIYQRNIESLTGELAKLANTKVECKASGTVEEVLILLKNYFRNQLPDCDALFDDITELLGLFEKTTQASSFRLLLTTVNTNMCRKFHTDINDLRLLCTYIGPGTLWVPDEAVNKKAVPAKGQKQQITIDHLKVKQVQTGDVVVLKGALYPDAKPVLHCSPSIEEKGEKRLLLRIDTNEQQNLWV